MSKAVFLKIVNPIVGILFLQQALTGIFHDQIPYEIFHSVHTIAGWLLTLAVAVHLYLNWSWVMTTFFKKKKVPVKSPVSATVSK